MRTSLHIRSSGRTRGEASPGAVPFGAGVPLPPPAAAIRRGTPADLEALCDFERRVWADRMSRRSLRRLLASPSADIVVAQADGAITGAAIVLFRANSGIARLYSIAVDPEHTGRGVASALLAQTEKLARARRCLSLRLEVHADNHAAIQVYCKAGYHLFGRYAHYYEDRGDALRFEKMLAPSP